MTSSSEPITNEELISRFDKFDERLEQAVSQIDKRLDKLSNDVTALKVEQIAVNTRIDAYQKGSNQVVNLAFALISAATVTVIVSAVLGRN